MTTNHDALREALELGLDYAREALSLHDQKYQRHPSTDAERALIARHIEQIEEALAASKPEQQAQAGEPKVVLTVEVEPDFMSRGHFHEGYKPYVDPTKVWSLSIGTELITLQSHREAIAKKDAALQACVAHMLIAYGQNSHDMILTGDELRGLHAAIIQAQEALK